MLKALGQALMERKEEFYALSTATGATRADSWVDIEGGIGTLLSYASKGRRELPNRAFCSTAMSSMLSKDESFSAPAYPDAPCRAWRCISTPSTSRVWGMLEKTRADPACGRSGVVKPASQTAYLTELMVRRIIETGHSAGRRAAADLRFGGRPARSCDRAGRRDLHRLGRDRPQAENRIRRLSQIRCVSRWRPTA